MALLKYFKRGDSKAVLPNPEGPLSSAMPSYARGRGGGGITKHVLVGMFARSHAEPRLLNPRTRTTGYARLACTAP